MPDADEALCLAANYADEQGCVIASDTPISSPDTVSALAEKGICAVIQPGGVNDEDIIAACNECGIVMYVTNMSHIKN